MMDWKKKWHPRGDSGSGSIKRGVGVAMSTWQGGGHASNCKANIHPDGSVEIELGSQDLAQVRGPASTLWRRRLWAFPSPP